MTLKHTHTQETAALKVGIDRKTARKYLKTGKLPSESKQVRDWLTRADAFESVWPTLEAMLKNAPGLEAKTLLSWLIEQHPDGAHFHWGQLRTLQRRVRQWRALQGPEQAVIFPQRICVGRQSQSDYTCMNSLNICINNEPFPHLLFHFMLPYSRWEWVMICSSESFDSLTAGYTGAVWALGAVAPEHRTDNLSAATHQAGSGRAFNQAWKRFLAHHGVKPSTNNPGEGHENGSVEKSHDLYKKHVEQQLLLRGSRHFSDLAAYEAFLQAITHRRNQDRKTRLVEEIAQLLPLPAERWQAVRTVSVTVTPASTISVLKGIYSVPARLIGHGLNVDIYPDHLEIRYGQKRIDTIPRLPKGQKAAINYRHLIGYLVRKPGAFANYQYRDYLFPRVIFRQAYDVLREHSPSRGHKDYLKVLHLAAITNETDVAVALEMLLENKQLPLPEKVKSLVDAPQQTHPLVHVDPPTLSSYDHLLKGFYTLQEGQHVVH